MTAIAQAKQVMEGLAGKTLTVAKMTAIVNNYIDYDPDTMTMTNEQKAQKFIDLMLKRAKEQVRVGANRIAYRNNKAAVDAAEAEALANME